MRLDHLLSMETKRIEKYSFNIQGQLRRLENRCLILKVQETGGEDGGVAQLGEHLLCKQGVIGSIPFISTTRKGKGKNGRETPLTKMGS